MAKQNKPLTKNRKVVKDSKKVIKENNSDYESNSLLISETSKQLFIETKKMPNMTQIANRCGLTRQTIMNHRKDFDKIWKEILLPKYKSEFATTVMENIVIGSRKNSGSQKLAMQIFGVMEQDLVKGDFTIEVNFGFEKTNPIKE